MWACGPGLTCPDGPARLSTLMEPLDLRTAGTADAPNLTALLSEFFVDEGFVVPPGGLEERVRTYLEAEGNAMFLASADGRDVGVATLASGYSLEYGRFAEIEDLYVVAPHRGRGIGRALVDRACEHAARAGCSAVLVTVTPEGQERHDLLGLYGRLGFRDEGRRLLERRLG